ECRLEFLPCDLLRRVPDDTHVLFAHRAVLSTPRSRPQRTNTESCFEPKDPGSDGQTVPALVARSGRCRQVSRFWRGVVAGPSRTAPSGANREPCSGQSQLCSASFQATTPPRCVHTPETWQALPPEVDDATSLAPCRPTSPPPTGGSAGLARPFRPPPARS